MMASYFGEILEPTSRAIFDEFSDDEEVRPIELRLSWFQTEEVLPAVLNTVFIYHGKLSVVFAEAYLIAENSAPIGAVVAEDDEYSDDDIIHHKTKILPSRIYLDNNIVTCLVGLSHSSDIGFQFANCISPLLKIAKKVIIFTDESCNNYRASSLKDLAPAFVRELKSSHSSSDYIVDELPVPNIIAGVPAAVASWCQIFKKDASLFVCYTDQPKLDSLTALPYKLVINKVNPELIKNANPDMTKKKFYGSPDIIGGSSNIYI